MTLSRVVAERARTQSGACFGAVDDEAAFRDLVTSIGRTFPEVTVDDG
jgi:hypothetical protein